MKIIQFCIPAPGEVLALTDTGDLWERYKDPKDFNSGPHHRQRYIWRRLDVPDFAQEVGEAAPVHA